jgi:hypothetical protein
MRPGSSRPRCFAAVWSGRISSICRLAPSLPSSATSEASNAAARQADGILALLIGWRPGRDLRRYAVVAGYGFVWLLPTFVAAVVVVAIVAGWHEAGMPDRYVFKKVDLVRLRGFK